MFHTLGFSPGSPLNIFSIFLRTKVQNNLDFHFIAYDIPYLAFFVFKSENNFLHDPECSNLGVCSEVILGLAHVVKIYRNYIIPGQAYPGE